MTQEQKRLVLTVLRKLDLIENDENQPQIELIRGLLYELMDEV